MLRQLDERLDRPSRLNIADDSRRWTRPRLSVNWQGCLSCLCPSQLEERRQFARSIAHHGLKGEVSISFTKSEANVRPPSPEVPRPSGRRLPHLAESHRRPRTREAHTARRPHPRPRSRRAGTWRARRLRESTRSRWCELFAVPVVAGPP